MSERLTSRRGASLTPDRSNWRQLADAREPPLTDEERDEWREMARRVCGDDRLSTEMIEATDAEFRMKKAVRRTEDWSDFVEWSIATRRLQRAELRWWRNRDGQLSLFPGCVHSNNDEADEFLEGGGAT